MNFKQFQQGFLEELENTSFVSPPENLYEPFHYIMQLGGKRLRPTALLMSVDTFGGDIMDAKNAAMAIEVFHNFTLVHDDIMDEAPLRRGKDTVHMKYDVNTAILSGDVMLIDSYDRLLKYADHPRFASIVKCFNDAARLVCEGQQLDVDFEQREDVKEEEYLKMIEWKTAVLFAAGLKIGALLAEASEEQADLIYDYGINAGLAFQIQDDILDSFGDPEKFGKKVGGDIIQGKKTLLVITALGRLSGADKDSFTTLINSQAEDEVQKVEAVKQIFVDQGVVDYAEGVKKAFRSKADAALDRLRDDFPKVEAFDALTQYLLGRAV